MLKLRDFFYNLKKNISKYMAKFLIISSIIVSTVVLLGQYSVYKLNLVSINKNINEKTEEFNKLNTNKNEVVNFSYKDIENINKIFKNKTYDKELLDIEVTKINFIEKIKDKNNKTYITVELIVKPGSELDLRKYLLLQSINDNIYKISNVFKRDKENVIELMFKV